MFYDLVQVGASTQVTHRSSEENATFAGSRTAGSKFYGTSTPTAREVSENWGGVSMNSVMDIHDRPS